MTRAVFFLALLLASCQSSYQPPGSDLWMSITPAQEGWE